MDADKKERPWDRHEHILNQLGPNEEPSTRTSRPFLNQTPQAPPISTRFEMERLRVARSTNRTVKIFVGVSIFLIAFYVLASINMMMEQSSDSGKSPFASSWEVIRAEEAKENYTSLLGSAGIKRALHMMLAEDLPADIGREYSALLFGPPGCGKTQIVKAAAGQYKLNLINVSTGAIMSPYVGQTAINVRRVMRQARSMAPCLLFFDEVDALLGGRGNEGAGEGGIAGKQLEGAQSEFLVSMNDIMAGKFGRVFIMGATNYPKKLDAGILRRFQKKIYIPLPNQATRAALFKKEFPHLGEAAIEKLAKATYYYTIADLEQIFRRVRTMRVEERIKGLPTGALVYRAAKQTQSNARKSDIIKLKRFAVQEKALVEEEDKEENRAAPLGGFELNEEEQQFAQRLQVADNSFPSLETDIHGLENVKQIMLQLVTQVGDEQETGASCLLYGPAGTGKTSIVKSLARFAADRTGKQWRVLFVANSDIIGKYAGESEAKMAAVFNVARAHQPCILVFDEINSLFPVQGQDTQGHPGLPAVKSTFQTQIDDIIERHCQVMVVATTNYPENLHPEVLRRFVKRLYVPLPTFNARRALFKQLLSVDGKCPYADAALDKLAKSTSTWTGADIKRAYENAKSRFKLLSLSASDDDKKKKKHAVLPPEILADSIANYTVVNTLDQVRRLHDWKDGEVVDIEEKDVMAKVYSWFERMMKF